MSYLESTLNTLKEKISPYFLSGIVLGSIYIFGNADVKAEAISERKISHISKILDDKFFGLSNEAGWRYSDQGGRLMHHIEDIKPAYRDLMTEIFGGVVIKSIEDFLGNYSVEVIEEDGVKRYNTLRLISLDGNAINPDNKPITGFEKRAKRNLSKEPYLPDALAKGEKNIYVEVRRTPDGKDVSLVAMRLDSYCGRCFFCHGDNPIGAAIFPLSQDNFKN